ncbi:hypothetical protein HZC21_00525 [Candidatus Peregrinibacteria bacterium]|nr:hypothetical protein [Candidatus Peregrinibacteria bacterium]
MKAKIKKIASLLPDNIYNFMVGCYRALRYRYPRVTPMPKNLNSNLLNCYAWFQNAAQYLHANRLEGVYAEFGSHEVNTFRMALNTFRMALNTLGNYKRWGSCKIHHFYAFDSFAGMPEPQGIDKQKIWRKGMNFTSEEKLKKICKRDLHRITTVKGFYNDSLSNYKWNRNHKIGLAYIDSDYYSSAVEVLKFIKDKLAHGAIVAFDDWNCYCSDPMRGEKRAFHEFRDELKGKVHFEPFLPISFGGMSFMFLKKELMGKDIM